MSASAVPVTSLRVPIVAPLGALCAVAMFILFRAPLAEMVEVWFGRAEYSHGVLIPFLAAFLAWQRRAVLSTPLFRPSWGGVAAVGVGLVLDMLGQFAAVFVLQQYAFVLIICGLVVALCGWQVAKAWWAALLVLLLMIPLPDFLLNNFSSQLQLLSSQIGVWFIRLFGISVYLEGNVIDLGGYRLQVAEACDGLRYLFPLMTLGFVMAYMFHGATWKRVVLFLSTIPVTILMNSFRIGTIGVMVEHWGTRMAEGFLHDFQGWVVFMASAALLLAEMMLLARMGKDRRPWREAFGLDPRSPEHAAPVQVTF